LLTVVYS